MTIKILNGAMTDNYTDADLEEMGTFAQRNASWYFVNDPRARKAVFQRYESGTIDILVAIASPTGDVAAWFGRAPYDASKYGCAFAATIDHAFSMYWDVKNGLGGDRDARPLAAAAGRLLHARAFGHEEAPRDQFLTEWIRVPAKFRPDTPHLLTASDDALAAASAMVVVEEYARARRLLREVRMVDKPAPKKRGKRSRISRAVIDATVRSR